MGKFTKPENPVLCACGCAGEVVWMKHHANVGMPRYIRGHNWREIKYKPRSPALRAATGLRTKTMWANMTTEDHAIACAKLATSQQARWDAATPEERIEHGRLAQAGISEEGHAKIAATISKVWTDPATQLRKAVKMEKYWANMTPEYRENHIDKLSTGVKQAWVAGRLDYSGCKTSYHVCPSGRQILVQSTWEAALADKLDSWSIPFDRGARLKFIDCSWGQISTSRTT